MSASPFADRRRRYLEALGGDHALLVAPPTVYRNNDSDYRYRQDSSLWWLTGWKQPEAAALFRPGTEHPFVLFVQPRDPEREIWTGARPGVEGAVESFGADAAYPFSELGSRLPELLQGGRALHYTLGDQPDVDALVVGALRATRRQANRNGMEAPDCIVDHCRVLHEMRLRKGPEEVEVMRRSAALAAAGHREAMREARPGVREYEVEAALEAVFRRGGASAPSFTTIVAAGPNAATLHYTANDRVIGEQDLVLVDAGCELEFYAADITRTFPAAGRFTEDQRRFYDVVLRAQQAAIARVAPGNTMLSVHEAAVRALAEGMVELGLLTGDVDEIIRTDAYKRYYTHRTGHWLGVDVHDVGRYYVGGESRRLEPGMVLTVEPGLYVNAADPEAPDRWKGLGVRIEDDVLVTRTGGEVLTDAVPRTAEGIEAFLATR